ncbi:MAG: MaoC family dehydratase [Deltaproteobacteria bacterium]|nr:MaoC family dehydratase [Deltaproteobacteria bacterium]
MPERSPTDDFPLHPAGTTALAEPGTAGEPATEGEAGTRGWRRDAAEGRLTAGSTVIFRRAFTERDVEEFGRLTRDYNPVHFEPSFAALKGFPAVVIHGLLTGAMVCEAGGQWAWLADGMSFRFLRPVVIGDTIECRMTIRELGERGRARAEAEMTNQRGETVLRAELTGYLPAGKERTLLAEMLAAGDPTNPLGKRPCS